MERLRDIRRGGKRPGWEAEKLETGQSGRFSLLNIDYLTALLKCELNWIQGIVADMTSGPFECVSQVHDEGEAAGNEGM